MLTNAKGREKEETSTRKAADAETSRSPANMPSVPIGRKPVFGQLILMPSQKSSADDTTGTPPVLYLS